MRSYYSFQLTKLLLVYVCNLCISVSLSGSTEISTAPTTNQENECLSFHQAYLNFAREYNGDLHLVAQPFGGLSDSLTGFVTSFLLAYASGRKFYLAKESTLSQAVESKFSLSTAGFESWNEGRTILLQKKDPSRLLKNIIVARDSIIRVKGNRGAVYGIVTSPEFKKYDPMRLLDVGTDYIFGCISRLIAIPSKNTRKYFESEIDKLQSSKQALKVGVQIRTREALRSQSFSTGNFMSTKLYRIFYDCVIALRKRNRSMIVFLLSDSVELRHKMIEDLQKNDIEAFTTQVGMVREINDEVNRGYANKSVSQAQEVFGESFVFSLCDVFIYTKNSGYGRVAAARAMLTTPYYPVSVRKRVGSISSGKQCLGDGFLMKHIARDSAGL